MTSPLKIQFRDFDGNIHVSSLNLKSGFKKISDCIRLFYLCARGQFKRPDHCIYILSPICKKKYIYFGSTLYMH